MTNTLLLLLYFPVQRSELEINVHPRQCNAMPTGPRAESLERVIIFTKFRVVDRGIPRSVLLSNTSTL